MTDQLERHAVLCADGCCRYLLTRSNLAPITATQPRPVVFVMMNPSTADAHTDDMTVTKCVGFARRWGHDRLHVVNLWPHRATDPADLKTAVHAGTAGACNVTDEHRAWRYALDHAGLVVAAWGGGITRVGEPAKVETHSALMWLTNTGATNVRCLGVTASDEPRHPSRLAYTTPLEAWPAWEQHQSG